MRVVDTSAWIEWIAGSATGDAAAKHFPKPAEWIVPTIVQLELVKWTTRVLGEKRSDELLALSETLTVAPLTTNLAVRAAALSAEHKLPIADSIVYATAVEMAADLLTCDAHFDGLAGVIYVAKKVQ